MEEKKVSIQYVVGKINSKLDSLEEKIDMHNKLSEQRIKSLEDSHADYREHLRDKYESSLLDNKEEHAEIVDDTVRGIRDLREDMIQSENKNNKDHHRIWTQIQKQGDRIDEIEQRPTKKLEKLIGTFLDILWKSLAVSISTGIIGFLGYLIINYVKQL